MIDGYVVRGTGCKGAEDVDGVDADDGDRRRAKGEFVSRKRKFLIEILEETLGHTTRVLYFVFFF